MVSVQWGVCVIVIIRIVESVYHDVYLNVNLNILSRYKISFFTLSVNFFINYSNEYAITFIV